MEQLETTFKAGLKTYRHKVYGEIATCSYNAKDCCWLFAADDTCPWSAMEVHSIETADWLALAFAAHLRATGH